MARSRKWRGAAALLGMAMVATACGSSKSGSGDTTTTVKTTASAASTTPGTNETATSETPTSAQAADTSAPETSAPASEAVSGGTLNIALGNDLASLDPIKSFVDGALDGTQVAAIYDSLFRTAPDGSFVPRLATALETEDNINWTLTLREGVTFSDGTPFNADAVKFNWDRSADPANAARGASAAQQMTSITVKDDHTIEFTLKVANARFPDLLQDQLGLIGSPTAIQAEGPDFGTKPVGAGPFTLSNWVQGSSMELVRNPNYWDAPRPYLDKVEITIVSDPSQRMNSLTTGQVNGVFYVAESSETGQLKDQGYFSPPQNLFGGGGFILNNASGALGDVRVRQALNLALDRDKLSQLTSDGAATPVTTLFPEGSPYYTATPTELPYDKAKAQELIDEYIAEKGGPVHLRLLYSAPLRLSAEAAIQQWSEIKGLEIEPNLKDTVGPDIVKGDYDITVGSMSGGEPFGVLDSRLRTGSSQNYGKYSNPDVDADLDKAKVAEQSDLPQIYADIAEKIFNDVPYIMAYRVGYKYFFDDTVQDAAQYSYAILDLSSIWLK